jgi:hypothetical protein
MTEPPDVVETNIGRYLCHLVLRRLMTGETEPGDVSLEQSILSRGPMA